MRGTGAYNNIYQVLTEQKLRGLNSQGDKPKTHGYRFNVDKFFQNDPENISASISGPNRYVTERWKSRLTPNEIAFLEAFYYEEMVKLDEDEVLMLPLELHRFHKYTWRDPDDRPTGFDWGGRPI